MFSLDTGSTDILVELQSSTIRVYSWRRFEGHSYFILPRYLRRLVVTFNIAIYQNLSLHFFGDRNIKVIDYLVRVFSEDNLDYLQSVQFELMFHYFLFDIIQQQCAGHEIQSLNVLYIAAISVSAV